jgi:hypothetical protein
MQWGAAQWGEISEVVAAPADTILMSGIASLEALGVPRIAELGPEGIESGEMFGAHDLIGTPGASGTLSATGISSLEAFGTAVLTEDATIYPTGIPTAFDMDLHQVIPPVATFQPFGIESEEGFGTPTLFKLTNPPAPAAGTVTAKKLCSPLSLIRAEVFADAPDPAFILPDVYGDFRIGGVRGPCPAVLVTATTPFVFVAAAHPVLEITNVYIDDVEQTSGFSTIRAADLGSGFQAALIVFTDQPTGPVSWRGQGRMDDSEALIENPIEQLVTLLTHRAGYFTEDFDSTSLAEARATATSLGWTTAWVFQDDRQIQDWITEILFNVMGFWRVSGRAQLQMTLDDGQTPLASSIVASIVAARDCVNGDDGVEFVADRDHLVNKLQAYYLYSWSLQQPSSRLVDLEDPISVNAHDELRKSVTLRGHRDSDQVEAWANIVFARQSFAHRVEGATLRFAVQGPMLTHATVGDILAFSWPYGPRREQGLPYVNQLLRILSIEHTFEQGGVTTVTATDTGTFVNVNGVRVIEPLAL